jgi:hypothetical protein
MIFPTMEESLLVSSKDQTKKTEFIQKMVNRAANKVYDIAGSVPAAPLQMTPDVFAAYLVVLTKFVGNRYMETSFVAIDGLRIVVKALSSTPPPSPPSTPTSSSSSLRPTPSKLAPLSSLTSPLPRQSPSSTPRSTTYTQINDSNVNGALFATIPALLKRLATRGTPKEMKQAACKAILAICKSPRLKGIDATVPFLGSSKFPLQQRLFILKLLTKEFGLEGEAKVLNCPMVMNIAIDALQDGGGAKKKQKVRREGITRKSFTSSPLVPPPRSTTLQ